MISKVPPLQIIGLSLVLRYLRNLTHTQFSFVPPSNNLQREGETQKGW